jgi:hypothetical protein
MALVAKARQADASTLGLVPDIVDGILEQASLILASNAAPSGDALTKWFTPASASSLRAIERSIYTMLVAKDDGSSLFYAPSLAHVSELAALFYVALFQTVRLLLARYRGTNPTWYKAPASSRHRLRLPHRTATSLFASSVERLAARVRELSSANPMEIGTPPYIDISPSEALPLSDQCVHLVFTSPPYCTRLDYVKATLPELAVLSPCSDEDLNALRHKMLGTPTIRQRVPSLDRGWGAAALRFLGGVEAHSSIASSGYYLKYFLQYFESLFRSLKEINRVLVPGGACALVVQDSYYKDIRLDLSLIVAEMASALGWSQEASVGFPVPSAYAMMNPASRRYRRSYAAVESFLFFRV